MVHFRICTNFWSPPRDIHGPWASRFASTGSVLATSLFNHDDDGRKCLVMRPDMGFP